MSPWHALKAARGVHLVVLGFVLDKVPGVCDTDPTRARLATGGWSPGPLAEMLPVLAR